MRDDRRNDDEDADDRPPQSGTLRRIESVVEKDDGGAQFANVLALSDEQSKARDEITRWLRDVLASKSFLALRPVHTLGGYAGTGKTTLLGFLAAELTRKYRVAFCTPTGKAATVLGRSLRANGAQGDYCGTIHRMMYVPLVDEETGAVTGWELTPELPYDLVVVDEASMLAGDVLDDMKSFGVPILAVGDHGQLPPVGEDVGLMQAPNSRLTVVRRQALDNPIIALGVAIREGADWRGFIRASADERVRHVARDDINALVMDRYGDFRSRPLLDDPLLLCGTNRTRSALNKVARYSLKTNDVLVTGDRVVCLKNAYIDNMILANGFRGRVTGFGYSTNPLQLKAHVEFPDEGLELRDGVMCKAQFGAEKTFKTYREINDNFRSWREAGMLFDYGNALTVHKAQGSQSDEVILVVERFQGSTDEFLRWLYTGTQRAIKRLSVVW